MTNNLDKPNTIPQSREHAEYCIVTFLLAELWDQYGIVGDLTVCGNACQLAMVADMFMAAVYKRLSICQHLQDAIA